MKTKWLVALTIPLTLVGCSRAVEGDVKPDADLAQVSHFFNDLTSYGWTDLKREPLLKYSEQICPALYAGNDPDQLVYEIWTDNPATFDTEKQVRDYYDIVVSNFCPERNHS